MSLNLKAHPCDVEVGGNNRLKNGTASDVVQLRWICKSASEGEGIALTWCSCIGDKDLKF